MRNKLPFWMLILYFFGAITRVNCQSDSLLAEIFRGQAVDFLKKNKADSAEIFFKKSTDLFVKNKNYDRWGYAFGNFFLLKGRYGGDPFQSIVEIELAIQKPLFSPKSAEEWKAFYALHQHIGHIYAYQIGNFHAASEAWQRAFDIFHEKMGGKDKIIASYIYHHLANAYARLGDYQRAESLLLESIEKGKAENQPDLLDFGDLMIVYESQNRLEDAINVAKEAHLSPLTVKYAIGVSAIEVNLFLKKNEIENAENANDSLRLLVQKITNPSEKSNYQIVFEENKAHILVKKSKFLDAIPIFQQVIAAQILIYKTQNRREIAKTRLELVKTYLKTNQLDSALLETHRAMLAVFPNFKNPDPFSIPTEAADFFAENTQLESLVAKSEVFEAMNRPDLAVDCLEKVPLVWEKLRETYSFEASNLQAADDARHEMERATRLAANLFFQSNDQKWAQKAFFFSEMARCQVLADGISKSRAKTKLSPETRKLDQFLRARDAYFETQIRNESAANLSSEKLTILRADLLKNKRKLELFEVEIEKSTPEFGRLNRKLSAPDADFLQKTKGNDLAIADFFTVGDSIFLFFFPPNAQKWSIRRIEWSPDDQMDWLNFGEMCATPTTEANSRRHFAALANYFFEKLLGAEFRTFGAAISRLKIMPDAALAGVPFELFCTEKIEFDADFGQMPWLLKKCAISYEGSATLFSMSEKMLKNPENRLDFMGFAPKYNKNQQEPSLKERGILMDLAQNGNFDDLPGARKEIETGVSIFGGNAFFETATESGFKRDAGSSKILHLAMHALLNQQNPAFSALYFGEKRDGEDNFLYATELILAENNTELVILSACRTGNGHARPGEGTLSLGRAFALAGIPATVVSWWRLPDDSTPAVVHDFYVNLKNGAKKDDALRQAKLQFLENNPNSMHPFFWAGLVLVGDAKTIF
jgi:tetratricopeptide (TPR) repeat protein